MNLDGYNSFELTAAEEAFRDSPEAYHPATIHWIRSDFEKRSRKPQEDKDREYGMARVADQIDLEHEYVKQMKINGLRGQLSPSKIYAKLQKLLKLTLKQWKAEKRSMEHEAPVRTTARVEEIVRDISKRYNVRPPRIGWIRPSSKPIRMAVYVTHPRRNLILHEHVKKMRVCDIMILALHEVVGHAFQEDKTRAMPVSTSEAEFCAMMCEGVSEQIMGTLRYAKEWKIFRITRALVDLRLNALPNIAKDAQAIWNSVDRAAGGALSNFVPFTDESVRCGALPAQALTYVIHEKKRNPKGCHTVCKEASKDNTAYFRLGH